MRSKVIVGCRLEAWSWLWIMFLLIKQDTKTWPKFFGLSTEYILWEEIYPWQQFYVSCLNRYNIIYNICALVFVPSSPTELLFPGDPQRNVVMWMDHRATEQADRITKNGHRVLSRVGGVMSPEMQPPKLLWLKEVRGERWTRSPLISACFIIALCTGCLADTWWASFLFVFYYCFSLSIFVIQLLLLFSHVFHSFRI